MSEVKEQSMSETLEVISRHRCFEGTQTFYKHASGTIGLPMRFSVFVPPQGEQGRVPVLFYLAGLTCTEETFMIKAGAQRRAAELGLMLVSPDTSPRVAGVPGEDDDWDFGTGAGLYLYARRGPRGAGVPGEDDDWAFGGGAGFYLAARRAPWSKHYRMESYVTRELFELATTGLPGDPERAGIFGHSMGGHGALTLALRHPGRYRSVSAFAPIAAPARCPWGEKAFSGYLGDDRSQWAEHDASELMARASMPFPEGILIDQGLADNFLELQLYPEAFEAACQQAGQPL